MARDYKKEYANYHSKPEQKRRRAHRNWARRQAEMSGLVEKGDGREVHHNDGNPANRSSSNRKVLSRHANRSLPKQS